MNADDTEFKECLKIKNLYHNVKYAKKHMSFYPAFRKTFQLSFALYFGSLAFFQIVVYLFIMNKDVSLMLPFYIIIITGLSCFFIPFLGYLHFTSFIHGLRNEIITKKMEGAFVAIMQKNTLKKNNTIQQLPKKSSHKRF